MRALPWALGAQVVQVQINVAASIARVAGQGWPLKPTHQPAQGIGGPAQMWVQRISCWVAQNAPHAVLVPVPSLQTQHIWCHCCTHIDKI